ncbi:hypothetical protein EYD45_02160 [Hyunsoonleella flava]|uniref:Uncharacterized protein n=1 Tax=Hyunsoonleella flava TaxID=2527939 RepID=A0A4Q9FHC8_9FLAO|nr:hypothetical protein [Hyunsoonleella flava]TBN06709.1 hypothetical protein EYD45_02160 [Hyunsoonleella flava]
MEEFREEIEKLNKKEEVIEYLKEKISELEIQKEQAVTKKDTEKYQEIIDELKKILDQKNKENVIKN